MYSLYLCVNLLQKLEAFLLKYFLFVGFLIVLRRYAPYQFKIYVFLVILYYVYDFIQ